MKLQKEVFDTPPRQKHRSILLVNPPYYRLFKQSYGIARYPLSLGYLAGMIKNRTNWHVMVYNADFVPHPEITFSLSYLYREGFQNYLINLKNPLSPIWKEVKSTINDYHPEVVGIYSCATNFASAKIVARFSKEIDNRTLVIVGGPHPSSVGTEVLKDSNIDLSVMGEGERTITEILQAIENGGSFREVKGVVHRVGPEIIQTSRQEYLEDLDSLCFPHEYAPNVLKDYDKYPKSAFRDIFVSRGCPHNCFFCGSRCIWGRKTRFRSIANVVSEIKLLQKMGVRWVEFGDDSFSLDRDYTHELCESLRLNCRGLLWGCCTRADLVEKKTLAVMKNGGCRYIAIGVESGNDEILGKIRKGITVREALVAANLIRKQGIQLEAFFLIGLPCDTEETLNDTFEVMKRIKGLVTCNIFTPYPGTEAFEYCRQAGLVGDDYDMALYNHWSPENCFCINIRKERFKQIALKMINYADKHNASQDFKNLLSFSALNKMRDYGLGVTLEKLASTIRAALQPMF